jgi:hypothetical protein
LIFSKLQSGYWPNVELVATKASSIIQADSHGEDVTPYLANGSTGKKQRDASPTKKNTSPKKSSKGVTPAKPSEPTLSSK